MIINSTKFAFFGTPTLAVEILETLKAAGLVPVVIVTTPDRPQGRSLTITPPPVKVWAVGNKIPYLQPEKLDEDLSKALLSSSPAFALVIAYGKIFPKSILELLPAGFLNVHYSLLPRFRGATPVEAAILSGDTETGVSIQKIVPELDTGAIFAEEKTPIDPNETAPELRSRLNKIAGKLLVEKLPLIQKSDISFREQNHSEATFCGKIKKEDGLVDLNDPGELNYRKYRAYFGWPGIFFFTEKNGKKIRVLIKKAAYENGSFKILSVVPEGKKEMDYEVWKN